MERMAEVDCGKRQDGVVRIVFAIGRKKVGAGWGTRGKTGFSNKSEACKKRCPGRAEAPLL